MLCSKTFQRAFPQHNLMATIIILKKPREIFRDLGPAFTDILFVESCWNANLQAPYQESSLIVSSWWFEIAFFTSPLKSSSSKPPPIQYRRSVTSSLESRHVISKKLFDLAIERMVQLAHSLERYCRKGILARRQKWWGGADRRVD